MGMAMLIQFYFSTQDGKWKGSLFARYHTVHFQALVNTNLSLSLSMLQNPALKDLVFEGGEVTGLLWESADSRFHIGL